MMLWLKRKYNGALCRIALLCISKLRYFCMIDTTIKMIKTDIEKVRRTIG